MKLSKALQGYEFAASADNFSPITILVYKSALQTMLEYLGDVEVGDITTEHLRSFMIYLQKTYKPERRNRKSPTPGDHLSSASIHRYWKAMRSFFKWAELELHTGRPDLPIRTPTWENKEVVPFTEDEIKLLLKACDKANVPAGKRKAYQFSRRNALRDKCIILVLLDTGMRVGELTRLKIGDVDQNNGTIFIRPFRVRKTHSRQTFIGKATRKVLWKYIAGRDDAVADDPLFVTQDDRPMTRERVFGNLRRIGIAAGVQGVHPHRFRHTFAIEYLRNGGDVYTLQDILGHSDMKIVRHYLHLAQVDLQNAHRKASPVDRFHL